MNTLKVTVRLHEGITEDAIETLLHCAGCDDAKQERLSAPADHYAIMFDLPEPENTLTSLAHLAASRVDAVLQANIGELLRVELTTGSYARGEQ